MKKRVVNLIAVVGIAAFAMSCGSNRNADKMASSNEIDIQMQINYCAEQAEKALNLIPDDNKSIPRNIASGSKEWQYVNYKDWTSGFWPGELWYIYELTGDEKWKKAADKYTGYLTPLSVEQALDHDLGFQVFNSFGNGYRLTKNPEYKNVILKAADTLATLFNPNVGTILSWPREVPNMEWPQHNTIMDNMINLELLFWASKNGGERSLYDMAVSHADVTMANHFRSDYTSYHVVVYDRETGEPIKKVTHQGYADNSLWARGQAWAIYGYTMVYRETRDKKYLDFAKKVTNVYLERLPEDLIPYWDFDSPQIPDAPRDASAAAVVASALLELSQYVEDPKKSSEYLSKAKAIMAELSKNYQSGQENSAALLHSTGHFPSGSEIDYSIIYADYYYAEAVSRLKKINAKMAAQNEVVQHSNG
ncbi:glycoside hydrolase family 88 protein [Autumnicola psychrophila]|uniref:Glycoside hydrolase family 88 protein n=1 Tax=Autumnicola psychrophila TaxID=3075592 RepID=A0ABU3DMI6_9FLAO|nr:glycoside hydrolase family 88 protein [Zunongwangia sp. F225]MDT0684734.1 glycoside hydrolase family 88 protein [Zunongwangia sp. F225]